jgi:uncharacterized membrane protein YbhN (UPF0104 family)
MPADPARTAREAARSLVPAKLLPLLQVVVGLVLFAAVAVAAAREWHSVRDTIGELSPLALAVSGGLALVGLFASSLTWRALVHELGSDVSRHAAARIYLVGQLGKYVPGSLWAFVLQMELGRRAGVPRRRCVAAALAAVGVNMVIGLAIGLLALAPVADSRKTWLVVLLVPIGIVAIAPPVLTWEVDLLLRILRASPLDRAISWAGVLVASGWSAVSWVAYGLALWVVVVSGHEASAEGLALCLGGVPLAMTAGFLVVVAPSGIGVREAALVAALSPIMPAGTALAFALVVRIVFTVADLVAAALTLAFPPARGEGQLSLRSLLRIGRDGAPLEADEPR